MKKILVLAVLFTLIYSADGYCYITPGKGNDIIQIIIASIVNIGAFFKSAANKIASLFRREKRS